MHPLASQDVEFMCSKNSPVSPHISVSPPSTNCLAVTLVMSLNGSMS